MKVQTGKRKKTEEHDPNILHWDQGFILLDSLIGFIILALVLVAFSSLFSSEIRAVTKHQERILEYLLEVEEFSLDAIYVFSK